MVQEDLFALFNALATERGTLLYGGSFPDDHTARLIDIAEQTVASEERTAKNLRARTTFALIEAYQNIVRHRTGTGPGRELLVLAHGERGTTIVTANDVQHEDLAALRASLERVEGLDADALKRLFLNKLTGGTGTSRGGAGLGFIEITRRTGQPLGYRIASLTPDLHRFQLMISIGEVDERRSMDWAAQLDQLGRSTGLLLGIGGTHWSTQVERQAFLMLDERSGTDTTALTRAGLAALQVVHGLREADGPAMVIFREDQEGSVVSMLVAGDPARQSDVVRQVNELNEADQSARRKIYNDALLRRKGPTLAWQLGLYDLSSRTLRLTAVAKSLGNGQQTMLIEARI